ncbi:MAG: hypothetical protein ACKVP5_01115 [Aestuariivirga sp.]
MASTAGCIRTGETSGKEHVSLSVADPEFGPKQHHARRGGAAWIDDDDVHALILNPGD